MCGRTCLTLDPTEIQNACKYSKLCKENKVERPVDNKVNDENFVKPEWRAEYNLGRQYVPSYNIAPTDITPVLVSSHYFNDENENSKCDRVIVPMMWGMIPFWHKGDYRKHGLTTNNCRLEHMLNSNLYRYPFRRGQRCVILCEGFYEWQTTKTAKPSERAAHLLYMPQEDGVLIYDKKSWKDNNVNLLKMAGLFDVWEDENGEKIYSYSVITFESTKIMSWLHHRMPAILETEEQINNWLDYKNVTNEDALTALHPATQLKSHRVTKLVNNSRNKSEQCNKPMELVNLEKPSQNTGMNKIMQKWLIRKRREEETQLLSDESCEDADNFEENQKKRSKGNSDLSSDDGTPKKKRIV